MASTYSNLKIELMGTGDQSGTWGITTNTNLGTAIEEAIVGSANVSFSSADVDLTLTDVNTTQTARNLRLNLTGTSGGARNLYLSTGANIEKLYIINNGLADTVTVRNKIAGSPSGTSVAVPASTSMFVYNNGTDISEVTTFNSTGNFTTVDTTNLEVTNIKAKDGTAAATIADSTGVVTVTAAPVMTALTASQAVFTTAGKALTSNAITGTGNVVMSASPTLTGTISAAAATLSGNLTISGGTANGVLYLNGSKVATSGSALTFDGNNLTQSGASAAVSLLVNTSNSGVSVSNYSEIQLADTGSIRTYWRNLRDGSGATIFSGNDHIRYALLGTEQMRLTSTGLGIGTSSPSGKLDVKVGATNGSINFGRSATELEIFVANGNDQYLGGTVAGSVGLRSSTGSALFLGTQSTQSLVLETNSVARATIDSSGNLGLGVTPSAWTDMKAIQINGYGSAIAAWNTNRNTYILSNAYWDGSFKFSTTATASAVYYNASGETGAHVWWTAGSAAARTAGNAITFSQVMTLDASGRLGIGVTSPTYALEVARSGADPYVRIGTGNGSDCGLMLYATQNIVALRSDTSGALYVSSGTSGNMVFNTNGSERARITSGGDLLVGTTTSLGRLSSYSNGSTNFGLETAGVAWAFINNHTNGSTQYFTDFRYNGVSIGSIQGNNTATSYNTSSDYRLKDNQQPLTGSGAFIDALKPKTWNWKADGSKGVGFIAHEVQEVSPNSVVGEKDAVDAEGKPIMQAMEYGSAEFIANIIAELQSLRQRVAQLEGTQP